MNEAIETRAERLAQAREHAHNPDGSICEAIPHIPFAESAQAYRPALDALTWCTDDHRTPAEQRDAALVALDAAAVLWAWFGPPEEMDLFMRDALQSMYTRIQRTEGPGS